MKSIPSFLLACVLLLSVVTRMQGEEAVERLSVAAQFTSAQGKVYSSVIPKTDGSVTFPIAVSESQRWIVTVGKQAGYKTFYIGIEDPAIQVREKEDAPTHSLAIFSASFDVVNGKPVTILKTDSYTFEVTLSVE